MIVNIKNWGVVKDISVNLSKKLVIMCGPNSTGKTYVSYILYTLFSGIFNRVNFHSDAISDSIISEIKSEGKFNVTETLIDEVLLEISRKIKKDLITSIFAISEDDAKSLFKNFELNLELSEGEYEKIIKYYELDSRIISRQTISFTKKAVSNTVSVSVSTRYPNDNSSEWIEQNQDSLKEFLFHCLTGMALSSVSRSRMLTVERNSIYTFSKELALNKFDDNPIQRYPLAVKDSLKIAEDLQQIKKKKSFLFTYAEKLEKELLYGAIMINVNGAVEFVPNSNKKSGIPLQLQMTSSIVKAMASLIIYLKYLAHENDLLIVDEPEMNLHPDNQIILTRIFAELVNKGLKLVLSTHSDYIIREFNNLIMAKEIDRKKIKLNEGESLPYSKSQLLDRNSTEVIFYKLFPRYGYVKGQKVEVSPYGFDITSIDQTILSQTETSHYLSDILTYGPSND